MAAPEGNEFWKQRSKHGRELLFSSPTVLWEAACEYFEETSKRVWVRKDWVGKDAKEVLRETCPPFTKTGLYIFLEIDQKTWANYKIKEDYVGIIERIEAIIFTQKFEGASVGAYNANIIIRDLQLKDATDVTSNNQTMIPQIIVNTEADRERVTNT
jgi:hypothetical protein